MEFIKVLIKSLFIIATVLFMAAPFALEFSAFRKDKEKKITYKRFRVVLFALIYVILITVALYLLKEFVLWLETLAFIQWIAGKISLSGRAVYFGKVLIAILVNFAIGALYTFFCKFVRIGLQKKDLTAPKKKNGEFNLRQKIERGVIKFFYHETWFFVGKIVKYLSIVLSVFYALSFVICQIPAVFDVEWLPYSFVSMIFNAGYIYPAITLLAMWEICFFLEGIKRLDTECPELDITSKPKAKTAAADLNAIDNEIRKLFKDYYACGFSLPNSIGEKISSTDHAKITNMIAQAVENDSRNPQNVKETYLNCMDKIVQSSKSILVNGAFCSEFAMYFLRYLSIIVARGDNIAFVCNSNAQIDEVYNYVAEGFKQISSLYCKDFESDAVNFDDTIWGIAKVYGDGDGIDEKSIDDKSILITSLSYLCSSRCKSGRGKFICLLDTIVFVDSLETVNTYNRQLAILNTMLRHITKNNELSSKNGNLNDKFRVRYMSKPVRYICFDDSRVPGLDKVLKNLLSVDIESVDSMTFHPNTIVRCFNYEGIIGEDGRMKCPHVMGAKEEIGAIMNMAIYCLSKGASSVTVFADGDIPYANIEETIAANMGYLPMKVDDGKIKVNSPSYNPDNYSVVIIMDSENNLPAALRKYASMVSDKPTLLILFSNQYLMRDYYVQNLDNLWRSLPLERIPVEMNDKKDIAQQILVRANSGGISEEKVFELVSAIPQLELMAKKKNINAILRTLLEIYGFSKEDRMDLNEYFKYQTIRDFDENGEYRRQDNILLKDHGKLFDLINCRDMVTLAIGENQIKLPMPKCRLTQNYIVNQNILYDGIIYHIFSIDASKGLIKAQLAVGGINNEVYRYIQDREYLVELNPNEVMPVYATKHIKFEPKDADVCVNDVYISVFRAPMEVITKGYYEVDSHALDINYSHNKYVSICDEGADERAKQTYRRYGSVSSPYYSADRIMKSTHLNAKENGALMMSIKVCGRFGEDINKTMLLAAVMLNELLKTMFPSVADSIVVCPVLHNELSDTDAQLILQKQPQISIVGDNDLASEACFSLMIIEDCETDLGVVSVLMTAGDDVLHTLFNPVFDYLKWYFATSPSKSYLFFGLDHEPNCFDFNSLYKLSEILGDDKHDLEEFDIGTVANSSVCDFCGKRYIDANDILELEDGRQMCKNCARSVVENNKKVLKSYLERARIFLESTYGIELDEDYEFGFESTVKIVNTIKQNDNLLRRGNDAPLKSYIDEKKKVHIEYSIPSIALSELLVRELTHVWQRKNLPQINEELAEGHIALVAIQYLRFLNQHTQATVRTTYYESTSNISGAGYRNIVRKLLENPQYNNNPFKLLLKMSGTVIEDEIIPPRPRVIEDGDLGLSYNPATFDRNLDGKIKYFYYSNLTASFQNAYDAILEAIRNHTDIATVGNCSLEEASKVFYAVLYDHPELFWCNFFYKRGPELILKYAVTKEEANDLKKQIEESAAKYLEGIDDSMSAYDAAIRIHTKIISAVDYDTIALKKQKQENGPSEDEIDYLRTICGVFLNGKAVCEGYARAVQYLLQKCGIESAEAVGYIHKENGELDVPHAWNIVKIDGDYYYIDTTWDDSSNTVQSVKNTDRGFDYFCITTEEILRTRDTELCPVAMPLCDSVKANYFYHNDFVIDSYDINKIKEIAKTAANRNCEAFSFKCKTKALYDDALARLYTQGSDYIDVLKAASAQNRQILSDTCSISCDKNIRTITVKFKFK